MSVPGIPIGTVVRAGSESARAIRELQPLGFECFQLAFPRTQTVPDLDRLADDMANDIAPPGAEGNGVRISALGVYGNPLRDDDSGAATRDGLRRAIRTAARFGTDLVGCFTGRVPGASVPDSIPRFREVFTPLSDLAGECGLRLAFENCLQGGDWQRGDNNLAHNPAAWELMFAAVPGPHLGLEWEPCHQLCQMIDPWPQLEAWLPRIFHIHGKDAQIDRAVVARSGICGPERWSWHRLPGFGDTDWTRLLGVLTSSRYAGVIDIEGFHDPVYRDEREIEGQCLALEYLRQCRTASALSH